MYFILLLVIKLNEKDYDNVVKDYYTIVAETDMTYK